MVPKSQVFFLPLWSFKLSNSKNSVVLLNLNVFRRRRIIPLIIETVINYRYKTKKTYQDKSLNGSLIHGTVPLSTSGFPQSKRIPVQMLVHDGKPCPADFVSGAYPSPSSFPGPFAPNGNYFTPASTIIPPNSQYYMPNGWAW